MGGARGPPHPCLSSLAGRVSSRGSLSAASGPLVAATAPSFGNGGCGAGQRRKAKRAEGLGAYYVAKTKTVEASVEYSFISAAKYARFDTVSCWAIGWAVSRLYKT